MAVEDLDLTSVMRSAALAGLKGRPNRRIPLGDRDVLAVKRWLAHRARRRRIRTPDEGPLWIVEKTGARLTGNGVYQVLRRRAIEAGYPRSMQSLTLSSYFIPTGDGRTGAVRLVGARIGGQLTLSGATLRNDSGPALIADSLRIGQDLYLLKGFTATGAGSCGAVRLIGARIGGQLSVDPSAIEDPAGQPGILELDGLVYSGLPAPPSVAEWLHVLAHQTTNYAAQPYRQLAAAAQAAGHDGDTRRILMAQRRDQLDRPRGADEAGMHIVDGRPQPRVSDSPSPPVADRKHHHDQPSFRPARCRCDGHAAAVACLAARHGDPLIDE